MPRDLAGLLVDPVDGAYRGVVRIEGDTVAEVRRDDAAPRETLVFPGFVDVHVYDDEGLVESGVTAHLKATRDASLEIDGPCLGLHLEGPFLNPEMAGAIPV